MTARDYIGGVTPRPKYMPFANTEPSACFCPMKMKTGVPGLS